VLADVPIRSTVCGGLSPEHLPYREADTSWVSLMVDKSKKNPPRAESGPQEPASDSEDRGRYTPNESRERFERAVDIAVATKPHYKSAKKKAGRS
jgi:hypothetical protein